MKNLSRLIPLLLVVNLLRAQQPSPLGSPPNAQSGTTYTFAATDCGRLVTLSNGSAIAVTLPVATAAGFGNGCWIDATDLGAGTATITPTTSTINGASTYVLTTNQGVHIVSDGTNYQVQPGKQGINQLTGDATAGPGTGSVAATVVKVNGTAVPTNSAADQFLGTTASATAAWASIANCIDSGGNHLNYTTSTHLFSCGTTSSSASPWAVNTQSFSATPAYNLSLGTVQTITLTSNVTSSTFTNGTAGQIYTFIICQDGTGGRTYVFGAAWHAPMTIGSTLSLCSSQQFAALNATTLYAVAPGLINQ